ncbi:GDP-fucose transporter-related protein [Tritrichomonas foetus]|uniref:GDP-fucose transporter-related protein n=1 Tax=Tritrichomonas foetus TaxID=1144522 RepID=A0A1J4KAY7_9EUKA|nr:GDP-fucose transporter-related protein [Tritrichomonas foetus]|eukprot:OHT06854.1 GDP-fucose transporter-related protein [Tritrichomonas foetus]
MSSAPSSKSTEEEVRKKTLQSALAVTFYMSVSIALVFLNRFVLTDKDEKAGGLFISWYQFVVAYACILIITTFCPNVPLLNLFPPLHYKLDIIIKAIPVSIAYLIMIGLNNKCLEYVSVSGYQIVRSLTILFSIILSYIFQGQKTSLKACFACFGVVVGFCVGVQGDVDLTLKGAIYGVSSSCFVATYSLVVKKVMGLLDDNQYLLIEYNTPIAIVALAPFVWFSGEFDILKEKRTTKFWCMQTAAGIVGFIINIAIFLNIKYTTPLTHNLSGTVKACLQTLLAFVFFPQGETMTLMKFIGTVLVIGFSAYYASVRKNEMKEKIEYEQLEKQKEQNQLELTSDSGSEKGDIRKPEKRGS